MPIDPLDLDNLLRAMPGGDIDEWISNTVRRLEANEITPAEARSILHRITRTVRHLDRQLQLARLAVRVATGDSDPDRVPRWRRTPKDD